MWQHIRNALKLHYERSSNKGWVRQAAEDRKVLGRAWSRSRSKFGRRGGRLHQLTK